MTRNYSSPRKLIGLTLAVVLHAALLQAMLHKRSSRPEVPDPTALSGKPILWLKMTPPAPRPAIHLQLVEKPQPPKKVTAGRAIPEAANAAPSPIVPAEGADLQAPPAPAPARVSAAEMLRLAKLDLGKIDKELRKEGGGKLSALVDTREQRLARGFDEAHAAAPQKWYQAAHVEDITPPGSDARKIYRITGLLGTYCVHYPDKNRMLQTGAANLGEAKVGACPHMF